MDYITLTESKYPNPILMLLSDLAHGVFYVIALAK